VQTRMSHGKLFVDFLKSTLATYVHVALLVEITSANSLFSIVSVHTMFLGPMLLLLCVFSMVSVLTMFLGPTLLLLCVDFLNSCSLGFDL